ncbi:DUF4013 domain-containing protein [Haloprofundus salilacus]|uniref:DUF4013 domain-containing protein n=1 Tax=Haloprofundus salilacus TaxID=2876190 RepID=UPI001CC9021E|nr:DUF4013 domain-containing protein [Haloprofundus salilacus]
MLEDSLSYPTKGDGGIARLLIGGVLLFFSWLVVPVFLVSGYLVRTAGSVSYGDEDPPAFEDWGGLLVDGLKATVITVAYSFVPVAIVAVMLLVVLGGGSAGGNAGGLLAGVGLLGMLLVLPAALVVTYLLPAALINFAREDSLGAAFDFSTLKPVLLSQQYIVATVLVFVVSIVGGMILSFLSAILVGIVLAPFYYFWLGLASQFMFGRAFAEVANARDGATPAAAPVADD